MTDNPPPLLAGEFPFRAESRDAPATQFELTKGAQIAIEFPGRATVVRAIHRRHRFGLVAAGLDPDAAMDVAACDPTADTMWRALGTVLKALAAAECNPSEIMDYLATRKCDIGPEEWADVTASANARTVTQNASEAARKLADD